MAEPDDPAADEAEAAALRLERAIERIATLARPVTGEPVSEAAVIAARLDGLIARLRAALAAAEE